MGRDMSDLIERKEAIISIHSPRMGRDGLYCQLCEALTGKISIHSPRMGRDDALKAAWKQLDLFQSTLPAWGETPKQLRRNVRRWISIHSPRMGRDLAVCRRDIGGRFQSTLPAWGETGQG